MGPLEMLLLSLLGGTMCLGAIVAVVMMVRGTEADDAPASLAADPHDGEWVTFNDRSS